MVSIRGLSKTYRDFWGRRRVEALRGIHLEVARGEILGLLGPNGSGKTTLVKALLGLVRPTAGAATIDGQPAGSVAARRLCGYLPEDSPFPRGFTPRELLELFSELVGVPRALRSDQVSRLLDSLDLREFASRRLSQLSRGTLRRVGFALALVGDPAVLLLDEPTSGMDPLAAPAVREELRRRRADGATVILSTHLASDVEGLCDRVAILAHGRLLAVDAVDRLLARPGVTRLLVSGLDATSVESVVEEVRREGGNVLERAPAQETLERVFRGYLEREDARGGSADHP